MPTSETLHVRPVSHHPDDNVRSTYLFVLDRVSSNVDGDVLKCRGKKQRKQCRHIYPRKWFARAPPTPNRTKFTAGTYTSKHGISNHAIQVRNHSTQFLRQRRLLTDSVFNRLIIISCCQQFFEILEHVPRWFMLRDQLSECPLPPKSGDRSGGIDWRGRQIK